MLKRKFDPKKCYRAVIYARMSNDKQNPRSPDQQIDEIKRRLKSLGLHWKLVNIYRDDGVSGRLLRQRESYQEMLNDLKTGKVQAELILCHTLERFGRVDDLVQIRAELADRHGILVLTADSNFADPTTTQGRALGLVESFRASEDGRVKAHNVLRGKRDAVLLKHWPGGPAPTGFGLKNVMTTVKGREEVDYSVLLPNSATRPIIEVMFEIADRTSYGTTRLAKAMNADERIPSKFKPFQPETIGRWLDCELYYGDFHFGKVVTGIVNDTRIQEANDADEILIVKEFCEPLVSRELWNRVQQPRAVRRLRALEARRRARECNEKLLKATAPGLTLNYLLSGLLFCECGLRMDSSSSGVYVTKSGEAKRYVSYVCPGYIAGHCTNGVRIDETWIRATVVGLLRDRLFS